MTADFSPGNDANVSHAGSPDWDAIARFLSEESSRAETDAVRAWLDANPRERALLERLDSAVTSPATPSDVDVEAALARVHDRMARMPKLALERGHARRNRFFVSAIAAAAAAAIVVFLASRGSRTRSAAQSSRVYTTAVGRRDSVLLADGTRVTLGPRTTLVVPADYAARRAVRLTGDAYFDVRHDPSKPFSVRVSRAVVEDIGTAFSVESDAVDMTSVAVVSGSVRLRADSSAASAGVVLRAGDRGEIDAHGRTRVAHNVVRTDDVAWTAGRLVFRDAPLSRVAAELRRWYGVTLRADDSILYQRHVSATFTDEPLDQVLKILGLAIDARLERQGDSVTVHSARGAAGSR